MRNIYVRIGKVEPFTLAEVATYDKGRLAVRKTGKDGIYSELPTRTAKSLKDAVKQVQRIYLYDDVSA